MDAKPEPEAEPWMASAGPANARRDVQSPGTMPGRPAGLSPDSLAGEQLGCGGSGRSGSSLAAALKRDVASLGVNCEWSLSDIRAEGFVTRAELE